ncbi:MAG TPA: murein biosynthesis integral membrane protein MurJ [Firmicutes bacterium]|nr:murein biosynthesis integral membrane protein MurJ [Bacillota bacterium]
MASREGLFKAAGIIAFVSVVSKVLGFVRETSLAAVFGATYLTDAYLVGQTIPMLVFSAVGAALGNTFIPVFSQVKQERGRSAAFRMANSVINATLLLSIGCIVLGEALAGLLTRLVAPGFEGPVRSLTVSLSRVMFPMVLFQGLSGVFTGMLQTEGNFAAPALVSLAFNAILITSILVLGPAFGIGAVAAGTVAAVGAQALLQVPALVRLGYRWQPILDLRDAGLRRIGALVGPVLVATAVGQLGLVVDRVLASGLAEGSVAALNYGNRLMGLVPGIFGLAIVTVMYPTLASLAAARDLARFGRAFAEAAKMINFVCVPVAVGMAVLRVPLVRLAFERGAFDARATEATAWALLFFCVGVGVFTLRDMANRAFFALQDTTTPMIVGAASVAVNIAANLILVGPLKHGGLALGTSLAGVFGVAVLLWKLRALVRALALSAAARPETGVTSEAADQASQAASCDRRGGDGASWPRSHVERLERLGPELSPGIGGRSILSSLWRVLVASAGMGAVVQVVHPALEACAPGAGVLAQGLRLFGSVAVGVVCYAVLVWALKVPEAWLAADTALKILRRVASAVHRRRRRCGGVERRSTL